MKYGCIRLYCVIHKKFFVIGRVESKPHPHKLFLKSTFYNPVSDNTSYLKQCFLFTSSEKIVHAFVCHRWLEPSNCAPTLDRTLTQNGTADHPGRHQESLQSHLYTLDHFTGFQASAAKQMRTALLWTITQRVVIIPYRRFGTTYRSHL